MEGSKTEKKSLKKIKIKKNTENNTIFVRHTQSIYQNYNYISKHITDILKIIKA